MFTARALALALLVAATPAAAGVLYKSVGKDGTVIFSDMPPSAAEARIVETRIFSSNGAAQQPRGPAIPMADAESLFASDEALARANALFDQAERELALARRDTWSPRDGLRIAPTRFTPADDQRIRVYRNGVLAARQALMDLLRERRTALAAAPSAPGSPYVISMSSRR